MPYSFTRQGAGEVMSANDINELQVAIEEISARNGGTPYSFIRQGDGESVRATDLNELQIAIEELDGRVLGTTYSVTRLSAPVTALSAGKVNELQVAIEELGTRLASGREQPIYLTHESTAGLNTAFLYPPLPTGAQRSVLDYGAEAGTSANDLALAIRAARDASVAGDAVTIPAGTYWWKAPVALKDGVSLLFDPAAVMMVEYSTYAEGYNNSAGWLLYSNDGAGDLTIKNLNFAQMGGPVISRGIVLQNCQRVHIQNLTAKHYHRSAVWAQSTKHVKVDGGTLSGSGSNDSGGVGYGIQIDRSGNLAALGPHGNNNWVTGVHATAEVIHRHPFILSWGAHHNLIENCIVDDAVDDSFDIHGLDESYNELRYNKVTKVTKGDINSGHGIGIGNPNGSTRAENSSGPNNWVHHNEVYAAVHGLSLLWDSDEQFIEENIFNGHSGFGIRVNNNGANNVRLRRNITSDNGSDGIYAESSTGLEITDHTAINNTGWGINLTSTVFYTINGYTSSGNGSGAIQRTEANGTYNP